MLSQSGSRTTSNWVTMAASAAILSPWPRVPDRGVHLVLELGEVVPEHLCEPVGLCIVGRRVAPGPRRAGRPDRKSTRLNSSHPSISYAVFCLKKKTAIALRRNRRRSDDREASRRDQ